MLVRKPLVHVIFKCLERELVLVEHGRVALFENIPQFAAHGMHWDEWC